MAGRAAARSLVVAAAAATGVVAGQAWGAVRPLVARPPAVAGAPLLIPVQVDGNESGTIVVELESSSAGGRPLRSSVKARLLWPVRPGAQDAARADAGTGTRRWARASNELRLRDEREPGARDAYLAVELPADTARGLRVRIGRSEVLPTVHAAAPEGLLARLAERMSSLAPTGAHDPLVSLPDPDAPFERFRCELGSALRGWPEAAPFAEGSADALAARGASALWMAALARIAMASDGAAAELAELLVARCGDPTAPGPVAAWIADPTELAAALAIALDPSRTELQVAEGIVSWMRVRSPLLVWIDDDDRESVTLGIANPTTDEQVVRFQWLVESEPPLAAVLAPTELARVRLPRPAAAAIDGTPIRSELVDTLRLEHREQVRRIAVPPAMLPASLEGVTFATFRAPLDLVAVATGAAEAPRARGTVAMLRPRLSGWEIFAEVRTLAPGLAADRLSIAGPDGAMFTVAGDGTLDDPTDALAGATGFVFRSYPDRFRVSFPVPPAWIERVGASGLVALGFRRDDLSGSADAPYASLPWRREPRRLRVDILSRRGETPGESVYSPP